MKQEDLELLYRSFDSELTQEEEKALKKALQSSPALRAEKKQLTALRQLVSAGAQRSFKPFFTARVVRRIHTAGKQQNDFTETLLWAFRMVGAIAAVGVAVLLANNAITGKGLSPEALLALPQLTIEETLRIDILPTEEP